MNFTVSPEIQYMLLVFGLFVVPRALQRFRIPSAVTCLGIGAALNIGFHLFHEDNTVKLLATLGIVPGFALRVPAPEFDTPEIPRASAPPRTAARPETPRAAE